MPRDRGDLSKTWREAGTVHTRAPRDCPHLSQPSSLLPLTQPPSGNPGTALGAHACVYPCLSEDKCQLAGSNGHCLAPTNS